MFVRNEKSSIPLTDVGGVNNKNRVWPPTLLWLLVDKCASLKVAPGDACSPRPRLLSSSGINWKTPLWGQAFTLHVYGGIISSKAIKRISPRINSHIGAVIKVSRAYKSLNFTMMVFPSHLHKLKRPQTQSAHRNGAHVHVWSVRADLPGWPSIRRVKEGQDGARLP